MKPHQQHERTTSFSFRGAQQKKRLFLFGIFLTALYLFVNSGDPHQARCLRILDISSDLVETVRDREWTPDGCSLIPYPLKGHGWRLQRCLHYLPSLTQRRRTHVLLIGDSRIRQLQISFHDRMEKITSKACDVPKLEMLNSNQSLQQICKSIKTNLTMPLHQSLIRVYPGHGLVLQRHWMAYFEKENVGQLFNALLYGTEPKELPNVIIISAGLWQITKRCHIQNATVDECAAFHKRKFLELESDLRELSKRTTVIWAAQFHISQKRLRWNITNEIELTDIFNRDAENILKRTNVHYWWSYKQIFAFLQDSYDGFHLGPQSQSTSVEIIINVLCNPVKEIQAGYCCSN